MLQNWPKNTSNVEDNEYETSIFVYNKDLDSLVSTSCISRSPKEEENSPPHTEDTMMNSKDEMEIFSQRSKDMSL